MPSLMLAACAHGRIDNLPLVPDRASAAHIVIIRTKNLLGATNSYKVGVDGMDLYAIRVGEWVAFDVAAGARTFSVKCFGGWAPIWYTDRHPEEITAGQTYYFVVKPSPVCAVIVPTNPEGMAAWYYQGDGLKLWEETYATFDLVPRPGPGFAPQMAGWFRKKTNAIGDYKGLKMRIGTGFGGKVYVKAGGTAVLTPGADIYAALERGVIDACEWAGPHDDMKLGLHRTARYYYYPGWHEPGTMAEFGFNKRAYEALPVDLRRTLDHAAAAVQVYGLTDYHVKNSIALERLKTEFKGRVEVLQLPVPVLRDLKKLAAEVVREESEKTPMARKVHASFTKFQALVGPWDHVAEGAYHQFVAV